MQDERDEQLSRVEAAHAGDPDSIDALAGELADFAALGKQYAKDIDGVGGFDVALLDEAVDLAAQLRDSTSASGSIIVEASESAKALDLRNRLSTLLAQRLARVRAAARFVFREEPDVIREATSTYERRKRAAARRTAAKKTAGAKPDPT